MKKNIYNIVSLGFFLILFLGCESTELDLLDDPSQVTPGVADPDLLLNNIQLDFAYALAYNEDNEDGINSRAAEFIRMQHLFGAYTGGSAMTSNAINDIWDRIYAEALQDIQVIVPIAEERGLDGHAGVAKLLQAYLLVTLVDVFGNVPYSEALQGGDNPNPNVDDGADIYAAALAIIDEAIQSLNSASVMPDDNFYAGDKTKWIKFANTLKFKMYVQTRLVDNSVTGKINGLIASGNLISNNDEDFEFSYSTTATPADSRHPYYTLNYDVDGCDDYLNSYYVHLLKDDKGFQDPRLRYYFYRQTDATPTGDDLPCEGDPGFNFCHIGDGYWTRDHGDDDGVPNEQLRRTNYGLYPIGGAFDADNFVSVNDNPGAGGSGIFPIILSSYVKFLQAEASLTLGTSGDPRLLLEQAIRDSMDKVLNFIPSEVNPTFAATAADVDNYVSFVLSQYDAATTMEERLDIVVKEYYIALWGNGIEAYNNYRRTSFPSDLEPPVVEIGQFPRSFLYPADFVNLNSSISQKSVAEKVFWDANPDNLQ